MLSATNLFHKSLIKFFKFRKKYIVTASEQSLMLKATKKPERILFFGTDHFSLPSLQHLHNCDQLSSLGVVTSFKNPINCVRRYAMQENLDIYKWPMISDEDCSKFDLGVVVSFGHLLPAAIIQKFPLGMINVHASLLPRWRGAAPIIYAIMHGDTKTGVSIMKIEPHHFDIGDILAQREVAIPPDIYLSVLHSQLAEIGAKLLIETIQGYSTSLFNAKKQLEEDVTYAPKVTKSLTEVNWSTISAIKLYQRYRAIYGFKSLWTTYLGMQVELLDVRLAQNCLGHYMKMPGAFSYDKRRQSLVVCCADNACVEVMRLRLQGRKAMSAADFNNGFLIQRQDANMTFEQNKKMAV